MLADFLEQLERQGQLRRVTTEVEADLEIAAITRRVAQVGGPALFFQQVRGHATPVVTNLLGHESRIAAALGVSSLVEATERLRAWLAPAHEAGWLERIKASASASPVGSEPPRVVKTGVCQQVVRLGRDVDLAEWPALRSWPQETLPTITAGQLMVRDPTTGRRTLETVPLVVLGRDLLGVAGHAHQQWQQALDQHRTTNKQVPVAVILGGDPLHALVGARLPREFDGLGLAGLLRGKPCEFVRCRTQELEVPTDADVVIEGYFDLAEPRPPAPPMATDTGCIAPASTLQPLHITAITQRTNPIWSAQIVGPPPSEAAAIAAAWTKLLRPYLERRVPGMVDYAFLSVGGAPAAVVSLDKRYPAQTQQLAAAWRWQEWLQFTKFLVIVDAAVDVRDSAAVVQAIATQVHPARDLHLAAGPAWPGDHSTPSAVGSHLTIDATRKLPGEHPTPWPTALVDDAALAALVAARWSQYGLDS